MENKDELVTMLQSEATTITALLDEIEYGESDSHEFVLALREVSHRLRVVSEMLANG